MNRKRRLFAIALLLHRLEVTSGQETAGITDKDAVQPPPQLQIDDSWPMQSLDNFFQQSTRTSTAQKKNYDKFMQGCYESLSQHICDKNERDRLAFNSLQPALMRNFTAAGYAKVATPEESHRILEDYLEKFQDNLDLEDWGTQSYVNHWEAEIDIHNIQFFMPLPDRLLIQRQVQQVLEKWCGVPLTPTSLYGIRVYRQGSILVPHVDRLPLVISAVINVAQDENGQDWPLEVIGHDGRAVNLTLQPGEMILYESHSIIHGRPYPLDKWYYANVFLHFEPLGFSYELKQNYRKGQGSSDQRDRELARTLFHRALEQPEQQAQRRPNKKAFEDFPAYVTPGTDQEKRWKQDFIFHRDPAPAPSKPKATVGATTAHTFAASGDVEGLKLEAAKDPSILERADSNGWKPIHEAARAGQTKVLEYLIAKGVDLNERTHDGKGASALWWAEREFSPSHPAIALLKKHGAASLAPKEK